MLVRLASHPSGSRVLFSALSSSASMGGAVGQSGAGEPPRQLFVPRSRRCAVHFSTTSQAEAAGKLTLWCRQGPEARLSISTNSHPESRKIQNTGPETVEKVRVSEEG